MPSDLKAYRIFIASPGGLQEERRAFREEIQSYNESEAWPRGVLFMPMGWEDTLAGVGRPQSIINEEVRKCDYFLLLLRDRWGSPTGTSGSGYSSGTEEEYHVAMESFEAPEQPMRQIVMMFKAVDPDKLSDPGPQLQKVLEFRTQLEQDKTHLFSTVDTPGSFRNTLRRHLGQWLRDHEDGATEPVQEPTPLPSGGAKEGIGSEPHVEPGVEMAEDSLVAAAWSLADEGRLTEAEVAFAKEIVQRDDPEAFHQYGRFLSRVGRLDQATVMIDRARAISQEHGDEAGVARAYGNLGIVLLKRGDLHGAQEMQQQALETYEKLGQPEGMASSYGNIGNLLRGRSDLDGAEEMYRKALEMFEKLDRPEEVAIAHGNLGVVLMARGDLDGAEEMYRKALEIEEKLGRLEGVASEYGNLGNVMQTRGDLDGAEKMYRKALEIDEKLGRPEGMANAYGNLGIVLMKRGDLDGAEKMYRKALEMFEKLGQLEGMANAYGNLGNVMQTRGDLDGAEELHRKSLEIEEKLGRLEGMASDYTNLGNVLKTRGDLNEAEEMYRKSLEVWQRLGVPDQVAQVQGLLDSLRD